eukprot:jgi/Hompol1/5874/HPOL_000124-RA
MAMRFAFNPETKIYESHLEHIHTLAKVETHNHPTAVSPFPGASTGSGGEIRDEAAVGQGSRTKAGLTGFTVSNLCIPGFEQPWETAVPQPGRPAHIASAFDIMMQAPLGGAAFNNEFGRPGLAGYFRTFLEAVPVSSAADSTGNKTEWRGYHKPIMIAGGMGTVRPMHIFKQPIQPGAHIIVLGGPSMLIGLGGGAASSMAQGQSSAELDFASVQRDNPEMQRRAQMVIESCCSLGANSPIVAIHDVGAGGLSNALPELVHDAGLGAVFQLRDIPCADPALSPMEIWCNESQERFVLAVAPSDLATFSAIANRERCPFAVVGIATEEQRLILKDSLLGTTPIDLPMSTLFGKPPKMHRVTESITPPRIPVSLASHSFDDMTKRLLSLPTVASKSFLITIGDRCITGLVARDQMVGPWQTPVADCAVILSSYEPSEYSGQAMAMGERSPAALISPAASARMSVAEAITNLAASHVPDLKTVRLSANWMSAASHPGEGAALYEAVKAVGLDLCPKLGVTIPVGKDSMSMKTKWTNPEGVQQSVTAPLSLIITAYGPVEDARLTLTPQLRRINEPSLLVLLDLAHGKQRLGGSCIAQVYNQIGSVTPDVEEPATISSFWNLVQKGRALSSPLFLAYHDRSDGGLLVTVMEMCFAGHVGASIDLTSYAAADNAAAALYNEELGAVVQIKASDLSRLHALAHECGFPRSLVHVIGRVDSTSPQQTISFASHGKTLVSGPRAYFQRIWHATSYQMQARRDHPECAKSEYDAIFDIENPGLHVSLTYSPEASIPSIVHLVDRPRVAILREQGVNSNMELANAFHRAGFTAIDVHMTDLISGSFKLADDPAVVGLACPGGFSYGDVLSAGAGWAKSILFNATAKDQMTRFFARQDTFTIGICNGCQMLSTLASYGLVPNSKHWPRFTRNASEQFEGRASLVKIPNNTVSIFFKGMQGSRMPMLGNLENKASVVALNLKGVQDGRQVARVELNVDNGTNDGAHCTD